MFAETLCGAVVNRAVSPTLHRALVEVLFALERMSAGDVPENTTDCVCSGNAPNAKFVFVPAVSGRVSEDEKIQH